jgi:hypothetical protein
LPNLPMSRATNRTSGGNPLLAIDHIRRGPRCQTNL